MSDIASTVVSAEGGSAPAESTPDTTGSFSFAGLHDKALAAFGEDTPATEHVAPPDAPEVLAEAPNVDAATPAQTAQLADDQLVTVTVDGEEVTMPWKDAKNGIQRQAHYTRSMQQLASERQQFAAQREAQTLALQQRDQLEALVSNPQLLQEFAAQQYPGLLEYAQQIANAQEATSSDDIATVGQLEQLQAQAQASIAAATATMEQALSQQLETVTRTIEDRAATAKLSSGINDTISEIFSTHAYLKDVVPNAEQNLRYEVLRMQPTTPEETIAAFKQVAAGWVENFDKQVASRNKTNVIAKQNLVKNNIMPPGGSQVSAQPQTFKKTNPMTGKTEVDWTALRGVASDFLK